MFCDMTDKSKVGVTTISHHSESRIYVGKSKNTSRVITAKLAALTRVSQNCKQLIKFKRIPPMALCLVSVT